MKDTNNLLTLNELAERLKVKKSWLYARTRERGEGTIPKIKLGKYYRFDEEAVMNWIKQGGGSIC